jgi:dTDP-4-dehydrorhamnose reductase
MKKIIILGSTGMLGSAVTRYLTASGLRITEVNRNGKPIVSGNHSRKFSVEDGEINLVSVLSEFKYDWIINTIGMIKQKIDEADSNSRNKAHEINSIFPLYLNNFSKSCGIPIIQIGTDCVYSGLQGKYSEKDNFDPLDTYGKSKLTGENNSKEVMTIRCSIIGKEMFTNISLMSWVLAQKQNAHLNGFLNHIWNGVTTLDFARISAGLIKNNFYEPGVFHLIPKNEVSKFELLNEITTAFGRLDIKIKEFFAENYVDRTLTTIDPSRNARFWQMAGYNEIPSIREMVLSYAKWSKSF